MPARRRQSSAHRSRAAPGEPLGRVTDSTARLSGSSTSRGALEGDDLACAQRPPRLAEPSRLCSGGARPTRRRRARALRRAARRREDGPKTPTGSRLLRGLTDAPDPNQRSSVTPQLAGGRDAPAGCQRLRGDRVWTIAAPSTSRTRSAGRAVLREDGAQQSAVAERARLLSQRPFADALVSIDDLVAATSHDAAAPRRPPAAPLLQRDLDPPPRPRRHRRRRVRSSRPSHIRCALGVRGPRPFLPRLRSLPLACCSPPTTARAPSALQEELAVIRAIPPRRPRMPRRPQPAAAVHVVDPRRPLDPSRYHSAHRARRCSPSTPSTA